MSQVLRACPSEKMQFTITVNLIFVFSTVAVFADMPPAALRSVDFVKDVQPILQAACLKCHGPLRQEGEYRLDVRHVALTGGASYAPNIVPFDSASSPLIQFVAGESDGMQMPSKGQRLSDEQIGILRAWIDQGATWPDSANEKIEDRMAWWSLQPDTARPPPWPPSRARSAG